jgi:hypothetical protein
MGIWKKLIDLKIKHHIKLSMLDMSCCLFCSIFWLYRAISPKMRKIIDRLYCRYHCPRGFLHTLQSVIEGLLNRSHWPWKHNPALNFWQNVPFFFFTTALCDNGGGHRLPNANKLHISYTTLAFNSKIPL